MNRMCIVLCLGLLGCGEVVPIAGSVDGGNGSDVDGGSDSDVDGGLSEICAGPTIALEHLEECFLKIQCEQVVRCLPGFPDQQFCEDRLFDFFALFADGDGGDIPSPLLFETFRLADSKEGITFHGDNAYKCLDAMSKSCDRDRSVPECELILSGNTPTNGACFEDFECQVGANCNAPETLQCFESEAGQCTPGQHLGQICDFTACRPELNCVRLPGQNNAYCEDGSVDSACFEARDCRPGFYCAANSCTAQRGSGADCSSNEQCAGDDFCVGGICSAADSAEAECDGGCLGNLFCNSMSQCQALPKSGQDCSVVPSGGKIRCDSVDFLCDRNLQTCQPRHDKGEDCGDEWSWCALGTFCTSDFGDNLPSCSERLADNEYCNRNNHCQSGFCDFSDSEGSCQPANFCWQ